MAEAVFQLSAEITPEIDDRALQRQGQQLAKQLDGLFKKELKPVKIEADNKGFVKTIKESIASVSALEKAAEVASNVFTKVGDAAEAGFLKVTNAIGLTNTSLTGVGDSIKDTIQKFEDFQGVERFIAGTNSTLETVPNSFKALQTASALSIAGLGSSLGGIGGQIQQALQPLGAFAQTTNALLSEVGERVGAITAPLLTLVQLLGNLPAKLAQVGSEAQQVSQGLEAGEKSAFEFVNGVKALDINAQRVFNRIGKLQTQVVSIANEFDKTGATAQRLNEIFDEQRNRALRAGGSYEDAIQAFVNLRNEERLVGDEALFTSASFARLAGAAGVAADFANKLPPGLKQIADAFDDGVKTGLAFENRLDALDSTFDRVNARFNEITRRIKIFGQDLASSARAVGGFAIEGARRLRNFAGAFGEFAVEASTNFQRAFGIERVIGSLVDRVDTLAASLVSRLNPALNSVGQVIGNTIGGFQTIGAEVVKFGQAVIKDLSQNLARGGAAVASAAARLGAFVTGGLKKGIEGGRSLLGKALTGIKDAVINGWKKLFQTQSPSKLTEPIGRDLVGGIGVGIEKAKGLIGKALKGTLGAVANVAKVAGTAIAGLGAIALTTGAQFNIMQQVINATLPVILGSASAANKLLDEVNALNDTSPFARSSFLELTKVMAGFGVEAEKIPPLIDAIQQTVAATGGGEQDIQELGQAFARLQSQGRLSGDILQSFSSRGVDILSILGKEFGKTTEQVRKMISDGLVPADRAIDVLTVGLKERFDGATDAVSKNFPGALDRVKARLRDIGATLTSAFIAPEGGGALVDLLNAVANGLGALNKIILPIFTPALDALGSAITKVTEKFNDFIKPLTETTGTIKVATDSIRPFAEALNGLVPAFAILAGFAPKVLGIIPVIGPRLAALGGPFTALIALIGFLAVKSDAVRESFTNLGKAIGGSFLNVLPRASELFDKLAKTLEPFVAFVGQALADIVPSIGEAFEGLIIGLDPIIDSFGRLFEALQPAINIIKNVLIIVFKELAAILPFVGAGIAAVVDIISGIVEFINPALEAINEFLESLITPELIIQVFDTIAIGIQATANLFEDFVNLSIHGINALIRAYNALPFVGDAKTINTVDFELDFSGLREQVLGIGRGFDEVAEGTTAAERALAEFGFTAEEIEEILKGIKIESDGVALTLEETFNIATKAAEKAQKEVDKLSESVRQQQDAALKNAESVFSAAQANVNAQKAVVDARKNASEAAKAVTDIEKDYAEALRDVIKPADELAKAERDLAKVRRDILKTDREVLEVEEQLAELRDEALQNDKRAALDRAIERAKIALNKARREEIELQKEANEEEVTGVNLSGLSLDQVRSKLANAKFSLSAQKQSTKAEEDAAKKAEIAEENRISAKLDVADAEQSLKDAIEARGDFEGDLTDSIRDNEERIVDLKGQKEELLLREIEQQNEVNDLRKGETAQQKVIEDFEKRIENAKKKSADAQRAITDAVKKSAMAQAELARATAEVREDTEAVFAANQEILRLKGEGLNIDKQTSAAIEKAFNDVKATIAELEAAQKKFNAAEAARLEAERQREQERFLAEANDALVDVNQELFRLNRFQNDFLREALPTPGQLGPLTQQQDVAVRAREEAIGKLEEFLSALKPFVGGDLNNNLIEQIATGLVDSKSNDLLKVLRELLSKAGISLPFGFASGYAPGELGSKAQGYIHSGMNDGQGLVRMFEYGKEAVLPLTRKLDMMRVVQNPNVLPAVLDALPRLSLPTKSGSQKDSISSAITSMKRSTSPSGGNFQSDVKRRNEQREFAGYIGDAVKIAVREALSESDLGADVDINVQPSSNNEVLIAKAVRREVEKALRR